MDRTAFLLRVLGGLLFKPDSICHEKHEEAQRDECLVSNHIMTILQPRSRTFTCKCDRVFGNNPLSLHADRVPEVIATVEVAWAHNLK